MCDCVLDECEHMCMLVWVCDGVCDHTCYCMCMAMCMLYEGVWVCPCVCCDHVLYESDLCDYVCVV